MGFLLSEYLYKMKKNVDPIEHYGTRINESLVAVVGAGAVAALFGKKLYDAVKMLRKAFAKDPEIEAALADLINQSERLKDTAERKATEKKKTTYKKISFNIYNKLSYIKGKYANS